MLKNTVKIIAILTILCISLGMTALADGEVIIDDHFNDYSAAGTSLTSISGWRTIADSNHYDSIFEARETAIDADGNTYIRIASDKGSHWAGAQTKIVRDISDKGEGVYEISFRFNPDELQASIYDCFSLYAYVKGETTPTIKRLILFAATDKIQTQFPKWDSGYYAEYYSEAGYLSANTWYDVKYVVNTVADKATVSYKKSSESEWTVYEDETIASVDGLSYLVLRPGWNSTESSLSFDDVKVVYHSTPKVDSTLPSEGADDAETEGATVQINFNMPMDEDTINEDSILVYEGISTDPLSQDAYNVVCTSDSDGNTVATVEFANTLPYDTDYTVKVLKGQVSSLDYGLSLTEDFVLRFKTKPEAYVTSITVTDGDSNPVVDLAYAAGETITVNMTIEANYEASAYIAVVTIEDADGAMLMMANAQGTVDTVNGASFKPTFSVPENAKTIRAFLWKDYTTALPLAAESVFVSE